MAVFASSSALDFPNVRAACKCPICNGAKLTQLVACWLCYKRKGMRYGLDAETARKIAAYEHVLAAKANLRIKAAILQVIA